jgi:hypothetical protein
MRDRITLIIAVTISAFVLIALIGAFILAVLGLDPGDVFPKVFDLIAVLVGAIGGFITGSQIEKGKVTEDPIVVPDDREVEPEPERSFTSPVLIDDSDTPEDD